jgi:hypothetical protein
MAIAIPSGLLDHGAVCTAHGSAHSFIMGRTASMKKLANALTDGLLFNAALMLSACL